MSFGGGDRHRWYLPSVGRYLELDPIAKAGGFNGFYGPNWYGYAEGNPLRWVDPIGLLSDKVIDELKELIWGKFVDRCNPWDSGPKIAGNICATELCKQKQSPTGTNTLAQCLTLANNRKLMWLFADFNMDVESLMPSNDMALLRCSRECDDAVRTPEYAACLKAGK